jgi:hypothetical protein
MSILSRVNNESAYEYSQHLSTIFPSFFDNRIEPASSKFLLFSLEITEAMDTSAHTLSRKLDRGSHDQDTNTLKLPKNNTDH